jgi:hypothetical protein
MATTQQIWHLYDKWAIGKPKLKNEIGTKAVVKL